MGATIAARNKNSSPLSPFKNESVACLTSCNTPIEVRIPLIRDKKNEKVIEIHRSEIKILHLYQKL